MGSKGPLIGSGMFESHAAPLQEMSFAQLLEQDKIVAGEEFTLTDPAIPSVVTIKFEVDHEAPMDADQ